MENEKWKIKGRLYKLKIENEKWKIKGRFAPNYISNYQLIFSFRCCNTHTFMIK